MSTEDILKRFKTGSTIENLAREYKGSLRIENRHITLSEARKVVEENILKEYLKK